MTPSYHGLRKSHHHLSFVLPLPRRETPGDVVSRKKSTLHFQYFINADHYNHSSMGIAMSRASYGESCDPIQSLFNNVLDSTRNHVRVFHFLCHRQILILISISGTDGVKPYNVLIPLLSLAYMTITLDATGIFKVAADRISNTLSGKNGKMLFIYLHLSITVWTCFFASDLMILITYVLVYYTTVVGGLT